MSKEKTHAPKKWERGGRGGGPGAYDESEESEESEVVKRWPRTDSESDIRAGGGGEKAKTSPTEERDRMDAMRDEEGSGKGGGESASDAGVRRESETPNDDRMSHAFIVRGEARCWAEETEEEGEMGGTKRQTVEGAGQWAR